MLWGIFGNITDPFGPGALNVPGYALAGSQGQALLLLANNLLKLVIVLAGLYALWNFVVAGYGFMSAGGEAKAIQNAWGKIWQSMLGLLVVAGSLVLAGVISWIIFKDASVILNPTLYGP